MPETFLTPEGAAKIKVELQELTTTQRAEIAARLRDAIKMGDLSENADYIMAKEEQAFLEGRIQELQALLRSATIVNSNDRQRDRCAEARRRVVSVHVERPAAARDRQSQL